MLGARALAAVSPSPSPSPAVSGGRVGPFIPIDTAPNQYGAGLLAFLLILGMAVLCVGLFIAMNRSLRRARQNLGGDVLPRRLHPEPADPDGET